MLEALVDLFLIQLRNKRYHENFVMAMTWAFCPQKTLHRNQFQMSETDLKRLASSHESQAWRKTLIVGGMVDVNIEADDRHKLKGWVQAKIERVEGDLLSLIFPGLPLD